MVWSLQGLCSSQTSLGHSPAAARLSKHGNLGPYIYGKEHAAMSNETAYAQDDIVSFYANTNALRKPEETIFRMLSAVLPTMTMLDIGVGGGRTTRFFAPVTKQYVGMDYSEK